MAAITKIARNTGKALARRTGIAYEAAAVGEKAIIFKA